MSPGQCHICGFALRSQPREPGRAYCPSPTPGGPECAEAAFQGLRAVIAELRAVLTKVGPYVAYHRQDCLSHNSNECQCGAFDARAAVRRVAG